MSNSSYLCSIPFNLIGNTLLFSEEVNFRVQFENQMDQANVMAYEWYLNDILLINEQMQQYNALVKGGAHVVGVRLLTENGWSGIRSINFYSDIASGSLTIIGPDSLNEGELAAYSVTLRLNNNELLEVTQQCFFTVSAYGSFIDNILTTVVDETDQNDKWATITAILLEDGMASKEITIKHLWP